MSSLAFGDNCSVKNHGEKTFNLISFNYIRYKHVIDTKKHVIDTKKRKFTLKKRNNTLFFLLCDYKLYNLISH